MKNHRILFTFFSLVFILYCAGVVAEPQTESQTEPLKEGAWKGTFKNSIGKLYKIEYNVSYKTADEEKILQIEMVNLDLKPRPEFTYQLKSIELDKNTISFEIPEEHDTKLCTLTVQENNEYSGECKSNKETNGKTSQLTMAPDIAIEKEVLDGRLARLQMAFSPLEAGILMIWHKEKYLSSVMAAFMDMAIDYFKDIA